MNKKAIAGIAVVVVVAAAAYYVMALQREADKWKEAKEIVEESITLDDAGASHIRFVSVIDAPLARVEAALWGVERGAETISNIKLSKLIKEEGNTKTLEMHLQALNLPIQAYTMQFTRDPAAHRVSFKTIETQTQDLEGSYQLEASPDGARTRLVYESVARQKIVLPFPKSVLDSANRETFVNTIRGVTKQAQAPAAG